MNNDNDILSKVARRDGMTVPEGYFADFAKRMEAALPERPELSERQPAVRRTLWQRVRPYAYMAAMFAGVWCMLKMFTLLTSTSPQPFESNPVMAEAFSNEQFVNDYIIKDLNQWDIYDEMMEDGIDAEALCDSLDINSLTDSYE